MVAPQRTVTLILLALVAGIALLIVVFLPADPPEPIETGVPEQATKEVAAEMAEVGEQTTPSIDEAAGDRVEAEPTQLETTQPKASFGNFPILVLDVDGSPAAGVIVRSNRSDPVMGWRHLMYSTRNTPELRSDEQGRAELPYPDPGPQPVLIGARKQGASAMQRRERDAISADKPWVLQLERTPSMLVRLVDHAGQAVVGQEVCWWADPTQTEDTFFEIQSDAHGEARFDDLPRLARNASLLGSAFGLKGVFVNRPLHVVQAHELELGEIEIRVPETGAMKITVRYADDAPLGNMMSTSMCLRLTQADVHSEYFRWQRSDGQNVSLTEGVAFYPVVEIGQLWQFAVLPRFFGTPIASELVGPRVAGEQVELEVVLPPNPMARHTLRVFSPDGTPVAKTRLEISVGMAGSGGSSQTGTSGTTDEEGNLTLDLPAAPSPESWTLSLSSHDDGNAWRWSGAGSAAVQSHDMPFEVHLQEVARIVSGQAVFADGSACEQWVQFDLGVRARDSDEVRSAGSVMNVARKVGTFDLRADNFPSGQIVLSARLGEVTRWTDLNVALGQENVTIVLPAVGSLAVRAGDNDPKLFSKLKLMLMLPELDPKTTAERVFFSSQSVPRGRSFQLSQLPIAEDHSQTTPLTALAGPMQWAAKDSFERLLFQEAFELRASSTRKDPHLQTLPKLPLQVHTLRVRAASGELLARAHASFAVSKGSRRGISIRSGVIEFVGIELPPELKVRANGFAEQTVNWTGPELEVILQPEP
jgi:hypothetical protein